MVALCTLPRDLQKGRLFHSHAIAKQSLWHIGSEFNSIWKRTRGENVTVAVLDTGISNHPDLPKRVAERSFIRGESFTDGNFHGTHCAGTAVGRNGIGVAPGANLINGKVLSNAGSGGNDGIAAGVRWAVDEGADIISLSIGGGGYYQPMMDSLLYALENGVIVNAAAGNAGYNGANSIDYPGKYLETLCQGAYRIDGEIARFSSGGRQLDWACPGEDIISCNHTGGYVSSSGTSMATPFGSGLLALIVSLQRREGHAGFTGIQAVRSFLEMYSEDAGQPGKDDRFGMGIPRSSEIVKSLAAEDVTMMSL
jgi:subtilisin family serine protease